MKKLEDDCTVVMMTPAQMMAMIEDFTDGLLQRMKDKTPGLVNTAAMMEASERLLNMFNEMDIPPQVAIIVLLESATAMFNVASILAGPPCPPEHLN